LDQALPILAFSVDDLEIGQLGLIWLKGDECVVIVEMGIVQNIVYFHIANVFQAIGLKHTRIDHGGLLEFGRPLTRSAGLAVDLRGSQQVKSPPIWIDSEHSNFAISHRGSRIRLKSAQFEPICDLIPRRWGLSLPKPTPSEKDCSNHDWF
jgi:hypothetical protein